LLQARDEIFPLTATVLFSMVAFAMKLALACGGNYSQNYLVFYFIFLPEVEEHDVDDEGKEGEA
jgi:hypothetical protein